MAFEFGNDRTGVHDDDRTPAETPTGILVRIAQHVQAIGIHLGKTLPSLAETKDPERREWLAFALADVVDDLHESLPDFAESLRELGRMKKHERKEP